MGHSKTNSNNGKINTGVKKNYIHIPSVFLTGGIRKTLSNQSVPLRNCHVVPSVSLEQGMMACNPSIWETETAGSQA